MTYLKDSQGSLDQDCKAVQNDQMSVHLKQNWTPELYHVIHYYLALAFNTCLVLHLFTPLRFLHSSSETCFLCTPNVKLKSFCQRSFAYHSATAWSSLPFALRHKQESDCFKRALKTELFSLD